MNGTIAIKGIASRVREGIVNLLGDTFKDNNQAVITSTSEIDDFPETGESAEKEYSGNQSYILDVKTLLEITAEVNKNKERKKANKMRNSLKRNKDKKIEIEKTIKPEIDVEKGQKEKGEKIR